MIIKIPNNDWYAQRGVAVPGRVWQQGKFRFSPRDFAPDAVQLKDKIYDANIQTDSLTRFLENPSYPGTYGVASEPNDAMAMYFAAYLVSEFTKIKPHGVVWHSLTSGFDNPLIEDPVSAELLVISNLTKDSSKTRLEKARDLLEFYAHIPRIVVIAGDDPVSFFSTKLYFKLTHLFFAGSQNFKRRVEVV